MAFIKLYNAANSEVDVSLFGSLNSPDSSAEIELISTEDLGEGYEAGYFDVYGDPYTDQAAFIVFESTYLTSVGFYEETQLVLEILDVFWDSNDLEGSVQELLKTDDFMIGNRFGNDLPGFEGKDEIYGKGGNDRLLGLEGNDSLYGQKGRDNLFGGEGSDLLSGGKGRDILFGDEGNDVLYGGKGSDTLTGGSGNDTFVFSKRNGTDFILDFDTDDDFIEFIGAQDAQSINYVNESNGVLLAHGNTYVFVVGLDYQTLIETNSFIF